MKIYRADIRYTLVCEDGHQLPLDTPERVADYMKGAFDADPTIEWVYSIPLNRKNYPFARFVITRGTATASLLHPREIMRTVFLTGASSLILVHNHPSGITAPSSSDIQVTKQIREAAKVCQVTLLDHVIVGDKLPENPEGYYSFAQAGLI